MSLVTQFGFVVFLVALIPVGGLLVVMHRLQRAMRRSDGTRFAASCRALAWLPVLVAIAPLFIFTMINAEHAIDPEFAVRSFENPEAISQRAFLMFALDQTLSGAIFDLVEVYALEIGELRHHCESWIFCTSLMIYRLTVNAAMSVLFLALFTAVSGWCWRGTLSLLGLRRDGR